MMSENPCLSLALVTTYAAEGTEMRNTLISAIMLALSLSFWSCGDGTGKVSGVDDNGNQIERTELLPADSALASCIRAAMSARGAPLDSVGLASLTELVARGRGIATLDGIGRIPNLRALDLADNRIADLTPLASLCSLRVVDLSGNRIVDLTPLAGLQQLEVLLIQGNLVDDAAPLLGLTRLAEVELSGNPLTSPGRDTQLADLRQRGVQVAYAVPADSGDSGEDPGSGAGAEGMTLAYSDGKGVYLMEYPSGQVVQLTDQPGTYGALSWAPDGQSLAVAARLAGEKTSRIYRLRRDGFDLQPLFQGQHDGNLVLPAWSPDGDHLVYVQVGRDQSQKIIVAESSADTLVTLIELSYAMFDPDWKVSWSPWSPDGEALAYPSNATKASGEIRVFRLQDWTETTVSGDLASSDTPTWSPDGSILAFAASQLRGSYSIYLWRVGSGAPIALGTDPGNGVLYSNPVWEPSGAAIAFLESNFNDDPVSFKLHLWQPDGNEILAINLPQGSDWDWSTRNVGWSPDGTVILVAARRKGSIYSTTLYGIDVRTGVVTDLLPTSTKTASVYAAWSP